MIFYRDDINKDGRIDRKEFETKDQELAMYHFCKE